MPLDAAGYKDLIVLEVGDDAARTLESNITTLWTKHDDAADLERQYLLTKRSAIDVMLGRVRQGADFTHPNGTRVNLDQIFKHLIELREIVQGQIDGAGESAQGGGAIGTLTKTAPVLAPDGSLIDGNSRDYRGDVYTQRWRP